jgi:hypothetical protein
MAEPGAVAPTAADPAIQTAVTDVAQEVPAVVKDVETKNVAGVVSAGESLYSELAPLAPTLLQEAKAGYKTTEFWVLIVWEAATQTGALHLPGTWGKLVAGIGGVASYVLSRGLAKSGTPNQTPSV